MKALSSLRKTVLTAAGLPTSTSSSSSPLTFTSTIGTGSSSASSASALDDEAADTEDGLTTARAVLEACFFSKSNEEDEESSLLNRDQSPQSYYPRNVSDPATFPFFAPEGEPAEDAGPTTLGGALALETARICHHARDVWIRGEMKRAAPEFSTFKAVKALVSTYNLAGKKPSAEGVSLAPLVAASAGRDVLVFGFQEIVELSVQNAFNESGTAARVDQWIKALSDALGAMPDRFALLQSKFLVGIAVVVFVRQDILPFVRNTSSTTVATGVLGVVGNKGACSVRFEIYDTSFCFVCAHLAAHADAVDARNQNVRDILAKTTFPYIPSTSTSASTNGHPSSPTSHIPERHHNRIQATPLDAQQTGVLTIHNHDYVVWLGDFNYRLDANLTPEQVFDKCEARDFMWLVEKDQLGNEMKAARVFRGMEEVSALAFLPTYKMEPGTDRYERRPEKKLRAPAWTDRILCSSSKRGEDTQFVTTSYDRVNEMRMSDHKPVQAALEFNARSLDEAARFQAYTKVVSRLTETSGSPKVPEVSVEPAGVLDFGSLGYREARTLHVTLTNTSSSSAVVWRFAFRPGDASRGFPRDEFVKFPKVFGVLSPNESEVVPLTFEWLRCPGATTSASAPAERVLQDVLDLRFSILTSQVTKVAPPDTVKHLILRAKCRPSVFGGTTLGLLLAQPTDPVPVPYYRLCRALAEHKDFDTAYRLFLQTGDAQQAKALRDALDAGVDMDKDGTYDVHVLASVLIEFLAQLEEPMIPASVAAGPVASGIVAGQTTESYNAALETSLDILKSLPSIHYNCLLLLLGLVRRRVLQQDRNKSSSLTLLAPLFAMLLYRPDRVVMETKDKSALKSSGLGEFASWLGGNNATDKSGSGASNGAASPSLSSTPPTLQEKAMSTQIAHAKGWINAARSFEFLVALGL